MPCNNQQHMVTKLYLSFNKLMEQSHKKLVWHMVLHKKLVWHMVLTHTGFSTGHSIIIFIMVDSTDNGSGDSQILIGNMQHYSTVCRHRNGDS